MTYEYSNRSAGFFCGVIGCGAGETFYTKKERDLASTQHGESHGFVVTEEEWDDFNIEFSPQEMRELDATIFSEIEENWNPV